MPPQMSGFEQSQDGSNPLRDGQNTVQYKSGLEGLKESAARNAVPGNGDSSGSTAPPFVLRANCLAHSLCFRIGRDLFELVNKLLVGRGDPFFG
jgi:hypothetical protein